MSIVAEAQVHVRPVFLALAVWVPVPRDFVIVQIETQAVQITQGGHAKFTYRQGESDGIGVDQPEMLPGLEHANVGNMKALFTIENPCTVIARLPDSRRRGENLAVPGEARYRLLEWIDVRADGFLGGPAWHCLARERN